MPTPASGGTSAPANAAPAVLAATASPLIILGSGGGAHDVLDTVEAVNAAAGAPVWEVVGFLDDACPVGSVHLDLPVLGRTGDARAPRFRAASFVNAIGSDASFRIRPEVVARTGLSAGRFATLVHPSASVSARARLGHGVCVHHGVCVGGGVAIGDHVVLSPGCLIGHDALVGAHAVIAPGATVSGSVRVGENCYVGAAACVRQRLAVGPHSLVGMGAVVIRDVPPGATVVGNPARLLTPPDRRTTGPEAATTATLPSPAGSLA